MALKHWHNDDAELAGQSPRRVSCGGTVAQGGVKSGVSKGWCRPISKETSVFVGGNEVIQNDTLYDMT
jgi:hypothetical protein